VAKLNFHERNDAELVQLGDSELVAYILEARRSGRNEAAVLAAKVLAFRYEPRIRAFVRTRLGSKGEVVTDEVAGRTFSDAIASIANFEGESVPEFGGWIFRIAKNRIVDYHRKGRVDQTPLDVRNEDGEWRERDIETGDPTEVVDRGDVINQALGELSERHRAVVIRVRFHRDSHKETAEYVNRHFADQTDDPMTEQNVSQINSRFGKRLKELRDEAEDPPSGDQRDD
jgi:RNA polymerase sigma factor (sigma-70 family)